jgi:hypothetical protein
VTAPGSYSAYIEFEDPSHQSQGEKKVSIDSDARQDLALDDEEADGVVGGNKKLKKAAKHKVTNTAPRPPIMIRQTVTYGPTQVSANSGDDDCAPEYGGDPDDSTT